MTFAWLTLAYLAVGAVLAALHVRRGRTVLDAPLVLLAWPLFAAAPAPKAEARDDDEPARLAEDVRQALGAVREAAAGSPFATLLAPTAERRLLDEIDRAVARMRAIDAELAGATPRTDATASAVALRADAQATLRALAASDRAAMRELVELLAALRTRIVLARHVGSSAEGPGALVSELWARIDGLGEAVALTGDAPAPPPAA